MVSLNAKLFLRDLRLTDSVEIWIQPRRSCVLTSDRLKYPVEAASPNEKYDTLLFGWKKVRERLIFDPTSETLRREIEGFDLEGKLVQTINCAANEYFFWEFVADYVQKKKTETPVSIAET